MYQKKEKIYIYDSKKFQKIKIKLEFSGKTDLNYKLFWLVKVTRKDQNIEPILIWNNTEQETQHKTIKFKG